jgi:hypothetical protein
MNRDPLNVIAVVLFLVVVTACVVIVWSALRA